MVEYADTGAHPLPRGGTDFISATGSRATFITPTLR
jgi:hypothetical protein